MSTRVTRGVSWVLAFLALAYWNAGCAGVSDDRGSYIDFIRVDQRPPLVASEAVADSLLGFSGDSERGDGIAEASRGELEQLVQRFAPTLVLPRGDYTTLNGSKYRLLPTNVRVFADTLRLDFIRIAPYGIHDWSDIPLYELDADSLGRLVDSTVRYWSTPDLVTTWYFDFPGGNPKEWWEAYARFRSGPDSLSWARPTVYAHPFLDAAGRVVIQYWYFYPFNDYLGNHEGDWEHVNVVPTSDGLAIDEVHYFFHQRSIKLPQGEYQPRVVDRTHPLVYVGGRGYNILDYPMRILSGERNEGSHGCFPYPGEWEGAAGLGAPESVQDDNGDSTRVLAHDRFDVVLTPEPSRIDYDRVPEVLHEWAWILLPARWGFPAAPSLGSGIKFTDVGNTAPFGPAFNTGWNRPAHGLLYPAFQIRRIPKLRGYLEDLVQPWYYLYIFRSPRYVHDTRGSMKRRDLERLGLAPRGGWREVGLGSTIFGAHISVPKRKWANDFDTSVGISLWRNFWAKIRFGSVEFMGGYQKFSRGRTGEGSLFVYPITGNFVARMPDAWVRPYVTFGGGAYGWESRESLPTGDGKLVTSGWDLGWTVGGGIEYYLRPRVSLDLALRYHSTGISNPDTGGQDDEVQFLSVWIGHYVRF